MTSVKTVNGSTIYMRDVAHIRDGFAPQTNIVHMNEERGALMSMLKVGSASTITIVEGVKRMAERASQSLPPEMKITALFDQSLFVRASIRGVVVKALTAALLTAAMILLFLGDWRPTIVISISIPLSIFVSIIVLSALGQTINIMTLGGLRRPWVSWSTTPRWKSKTSSETLPKARNERAILMAQHRSRFRPSCRRFASASYSYPCFS